MGRQHNRIGTWTTESTRAKTPVPRRDRELYGCMLMLAGGRTAFYLSAGVEVHLNLNLIARAGSTNGGDRGRQLPVVARPYLVVNARLRVGKTHPGIPEHPNGCPCRLTGRGSPDHVGKRQQSLDASLIFAGAVRVDHRLHGPDGRTSRSGAALNIRG